MAKLNPFKLFGFEYRFNIEQVTIITQFANLQKEYHPDLHNANYNAALDITNAFEILKDEIKRGEEILKIHNLDINSIQIPQSFLVMLIECEKNEAMEIYSKQKEIVKGFGIINENNIAFFGIEFLKYKYLKTKLFG
jgi:hypothetical protein